MTTVAAGARVWLDEGFLCAQCDACSVYLELAERTELRTTEAARRQFLSAHPDGGAQHLTAIGEGWIRPLSGPGAWSQ